MEDEAEREPDAGPAEGARARAGPGPRRARETLSQTVGELPGRTGSGGLDGRGGGSGSGSGALQRRAGRAAGACLWLGPAEATSAPNFPAAAAPRGRPD
jgi:hypothetical protein